MQTILIEKYQRRERLQQKHTNLANAPRSNEDDDVRRPVFGFPCPCLALNLPLLAAYIRSLSVRVCSFLSMRRPVN